MIKRKKLSQDEAAQLKKEKLHNEASGISAQDDGQKPDNEGG